MSQPLSQLSLSALERMRGQLEAKLSLFHSSFLAYHNRSPTPQECHPVEPAMKWYQAVSHEIARREEAAVQAKRREQTDHMRQGSHAGDFEDRLTRALTRNQISTVPQESCSLLNLFPGPAILELIVNWAQAKPEPLLCYQMTCSFLLSPRALFSSMLRDGAELQSTDISSSASWTTEFQAATAALLFCAQPLMQGGTFEEIAVLFLLTTSLLAITFGIVGSVLLNTRTQDVPIFVTIENMQWLLYLGFAFLVLALLSFFAQYVRTLRQVRALLEEEVWTLQMKLAESADAIRTGDVKEAQLHAEDIASMLPDNEVYIGGRAKGASEALQQLQLARKTKSGRHRIEVLALLSKRRHAGVALVSAVLWLEYFGLLPSEWEVVPVGRDAMLALACGFTAVSTLILAYQIIVLFPAGLVRPRVPIGSLRWPQAGECQPCTFLSGPANISSAGSTCPASLELRLCSGVSTRRLKAAPDVSCDVEWSYSIPGATLTLLCFSLGTLWLFHELIAQHTSRYASLQIEAKQKAPTERKKTTGAGRFLTRRMKAVGRSTFGNLRQRMHANKQASLRLRGAGGRGGGWRARLGRWASRSASHDPGPSGWGSSHVICPGFGVSFGT
ncbi:MAG: hypothetical protein SGPRY_009102 [Prymnesium sp.]